MAIERREPEDPDGSATIVTTACPFCDEPIPEQFALADHLRDGCPAREGADDV